jgi:uncharacterized membrane protein
MNRLLTILPLAFWRNLASLSLIGLILWVILWNGWLTPYQRVPRWLELLLLLTPLLSLLRGVLYSRPQALFYALLASLVYVTMGVWYVLEPPEQLYGYLLIAFSIGLYAGAFMSLRIGQKQAEIEANGE